KNLKGVYNLYEQNLVLFQPHSKQSDDDVIKIENIHSKELDEQIGEDTAETLRSELELVEGVYPEFSVTDYLNGEVSPVFYGSAVNNFGVKELLDCFIEIAPHPLPAKTESREVSPFEKELSGFVFKIHANLDPNHRNRIAFLKIVSGKFERNKSYKHVRLQKQLKISSPTAFMADKKNIIDEAFPGDIVGIPDSGNFKIGDALTSGEDLVFKGIPSFSPELFKYVENADPMKAKQLYKGLEQLTDEGVAQLFTMKSNGRKIIGTVGALQFDVIQHRLQHEYGAKCRYEPLNMYKACWITSENKEQLEEFKKRKHQYMAEDKQKRDVFLALSAFALQMAQQDYPEIEFHFKSDF
ncbi:MAG: peptide chain release factor 3, partial [Bacteroidetes bacterium]